VSHRTRGLVSMVGHRVRSSRGEHHTTLSVGLAGHCAASALARPAQSSIPEEAGVDAPWIWLNCWPAGGA
jgi:hypothetical protein